MLGPTPQEFSLGREKFIADTIDHMQLIIRAVPKFLLQVTDKTIHTPSTRRLVAEYVQKQEAKYHILRQKLIPIYMKQRKVSYFNTPLSLRQSFLQRAAVMIAPPVWRQLKDLLEYDIQ